MIRMLTAVALAVVTVTLAASGLQETGLQPGDLAPDFTLPGSDGKTYRLSDYQGVRPVVLAWFPRTFVKE